MLSAASGFSAAPSERDEVESVLNEALLSALFPVFEWDDPLHIEGEEAEDIARLLEESARANGVDHEVRSVLEDALRQEIVVMGSGDAIHDIGPLACSDLRSSIPVSVPPTRLSPHASDVALSRTPTPQRMGVGLFASSPTSASTVVTLGGLTLAGSHRGSSPNAALTDTLRASFGAGSFFGHGVLTLGDAHLNSSRSSLMSSGDIGDRSISLDETSHTSSVYALNETGESHTIFNEAAQLDFTQLIALGRAPTRQQLSDDEVRALPRVRFEAPEMQRCSICLETFRHGMLLTGLNCGHVFHVDCLSRWVQRSAMCPNCRSHIEPLAPHLAHRQ
mmetsp:Transcript_14298/g.39482  ORF Transcript_14298/g.39482 Transcript_14298/m.39482 type:complete len:334 (+) Transcript_14298:52-1053(+)